MALAVLLLLLAGGVFAWTKRASLKPESVRIGMPTNNVRLSWKTFNYNEQGHYGSKIQFESRQSDSFGGSYSLSCRDGKVYAVEINYPAGLEREKSLAVLARVLGQDANKPNEHDDKELSMKNCEKPSEYFYFDGGKCGAQLDYQDKDSKRVSRIYCWLV